MSLLTHRFLQDGIRVTMAKMHRYAGWQLVYPCHFRLSLKKYCRSCCLVCITAISFPNNTFGLTHLSDTTTFIESNSEFIAGSDTMSLSLGDPDKVIFRLHDLPLELVQRIIRECFLVRGLGRGMRLRLVNRE
jgi:hypothetical protein